MPARQHEREAGAPVLSRANLQRRLAAIAQAKRGNLQHQWLDVFGSRPPKRLSTALLVLALSYHAQADKDDGLRESECAALGLPPRDGLEVAPSSAEGAMLCQLPAPRGDHLPATRVRMLRACHVSKRQVGRTSIPSGAKRTQTTYAKPRWSQYRAPHLARFADRSSQARVCYVSGRGRLMKWSPMAAVDSSIAGRPMDRSARWHVSSPERDGQGQPSSGSPPRRKRIDLWDSKMLEVEGQRGRAREAVASSAGAGSRKPSKPSSNQRVRHCAIYTRKSSEEGLEQSFNSLDAQREACEAYIASQKHEGWVLVPTAYDDGGLSGGTMNRPALQALLADIGGGRVDVVVVYKVDRLTRSLADFAKLTDLLDAAGASFVSVTQAFNTSTSMGRLTLNVLLSFAQFEREVAGERIRDKIAASKKRGMWMGGMPPLDTTFETSSWS